MSHRLHTPASRCDDCNGDPHTLDEPGWQKHFRTHTEYAIVWTCCTRKLMYRSAPLTKPIGLAAADKAAAAAPAGQLQDGPGRYSIVGFVSHMGASTSAGHYVSHIRKAGRWVIFNDEKVLPPSCCLSICCPRKADACTCHRPTVVLVRTLP